MADFKQITVGGVSHPVKDEVARQGLAGKQDKLTFDDTPTANSNNPVKSGGVYEAIRSIDVSGQISGKADKSEMSVVAGTGADADKTTITLKNGTSATVLTQHQDISGKQDVIEDLSTIRSGAAAGTTAVQSAAMNTALAAKQDTISDLATLRSGAAAGATAYQKPGTGIPSTDLASAVQTSLERADEAAVRPYNNQSPDGMGYLVLDKNATFASQVTSANTIYEIRYDYDLNGQTITIPDGCVLKFNGGSLQNGTVAGQGAEVIGCKGCFSNISINGIASELHSVWFKDDLQDCLGNIVDSTIVIDHGAYTFTKQVNLRQGVIIKSDNAKISTSYPIYIGYRVEIYDVEIVSSAAHALVIDNVWVKNSRTSDYIAKHGIDENRVGAIVKHSNLSCSSYNNTSSIYIVLNAGGVNMNCIHIDNNVFKKAEIGVECFNNVSMTEEIKPWSTQHYISDNSFQLCLNAIKYHRLSELQDYIAEIHSFSGINITGNASQYRNVVEGGVTYSTNYFVYAEGVYYLSCKNNLPWDFDPTSQYKLCVYDQSFVTIDDTLDAKVEYFGMDDLLSLVSAGKNINPSDVCNESHFHTTLPSPIDGSNYTVLDLLVLDNERGYLVDKNSTFCTQFGFVSGYEGILRKHRIGKYRMNIEIVFPASGGNPSTTYNANLSIYHGSFYIRLQDIKQYLQTALGDVFFPVQFINTKYQDPAYLTKGSIFFSGLTGGVKAVNRTGGILNIALLSSGTTAQRPSSPFSAGFTYFDTTLGKPLWWNGTAWVDATGTAV